MLHFTKGKLNLVGIYIIEYGLIDDNFLLLRNFPDFEGCKFGGMIVSLQ